MTSLVTLANDDFQGVERKRVNTEMRGVCVCVCCLVFGHTLDYMQK